MRPKMETISLATGVLTGIIIAYIIFYLLNKTKNVAKPEFDELLSKHNETVITLRLAENKAQTLQATNDILSNKIGLKENEAAQLQIKSASLETQLNYSKTTSSLWFLPSSSLIDC